MLNWEDLSMPEYERYFHSLCDVSRAFGTTQSSGELLNLVVEKAIDTMEVKAACLFMADEEDDLFQKAAQKGLSDQYFHAGPIHVKKNLPVIDREGYLYSHDACQDPRLDNLEGKKAEGICSLLSVPVRVTGELIGVLSLYTASPREFTHEEIEFLTAMAEQGAMSIERARLIERISKNIDLFLDVTTKINSSLEIKEILQAMTVEITRAFKVKGASIRLLDEDSNQLKLVTSHGLSEKYLSKGPASGDPTHNQVLKGEVVIVEDVTSDERVLYRDEKKEEGIVSLLTVPVKAKKKVIGTLRLYSNKPRTFREDEIRLATAMANQGGLALQNANLYLILQEDMKDLQEETWSHRSWF
jgi:GAF domain-containing protein